MASGGIIHHLCVAACMCSLCTIFIEANFEQSVVATSLAMHYILYYMHIMHGYTLMARCMLCNSQPICVMSIVANFERPGGRLCVAGVRRVQWWPFVCSSRPCVADLRVWSVLINSQLAYYVTHISFRQLSSHIEQP